MSAWNNNWCYLNEKNREIFQTSLTSKPNYYEKAII